MSHHSPLLFFVLLLSVHGAVCYNYNYNYDLHRRPQSVTVIQSSRDDVEGCSSCLDFMVNGLSVMIKAVNGIGPLDNCSTLCAMLNNATHTAECASLCTTVGYDPYWHVFERSNLDPIWACQLLTACAVASSPSAAFTKTAITPPQGVAGDTFAISLAFNVANDTGVGMLLYVVYFPSGLQKSVNKNYFVNYGQGDHLVNFQFQTVKNDTFTEGKYPIFFALCSGECNSYNPNSITLSEKDGSLQLLPS